MNTDRNNNESQTLRAHHSQKLKQNLICRLNRIEGQIRGVKKQIESDTYCDDVLNLLASIQSALSGVSSLLIENHIRSCVSEQIREGNTEVIDELMKTIRRMLK